MNTCRWKVVSIAEFPVIKDLERAALTHQGLEADSCWTCGYCAGVPLTTMDNIRAHVQLRSVLLIHSSRLPVLMSFSPL